MPNRPSVSTKYWCVPNRPSLWLSNYLINVPNRPPLNKYLDLWGSIWIFKGLFGPLIVKLHMLRVYLAKSVLLYNDEGLFGFNEGLFGTRVYLEKTLWRSKRYVLIIMALTHFFITRYHKILSVCSFWYKNLLKFTCSFEFPQLTLH